MKCQIKIIHFLHFPLLIIDVKLWKMIHKSLGIKKKLNTNIEINHKIPLKLIF